jgi:hypothetical protein
MISMFTDAVGQGFLLYLLDNQLANGQHSACVSRPSGYTVAMRVKAVFRNGRLEREPGVTFHQGTEPSLFTVDEEDDLDDEERARLRASIERIAAHLRLRSAAGTDRVSACLRNTRSRLGMGARLALARGETEPTPLAAPISALLAGSLRGMAGGVAKEDPDRTLIGAQRCDHAISRAND